jgi:hypothetical protein
MRCHAPPWVPKANLFEAALNEANLLEATFLDVTLNKP